MHAANIQGNDVLRSRRVRRAARGVDDRAGRAAAQYERAKNTAGGADRRNPVDPDRSLAEIFQNQTGVMGCSWLKPTAPRWDHT